MTETPGSSRYHLRRAAVLEELSSAYGLGQHEVARQGTPQGEISVEVGPALTASLLKRPLTDAELDQLERWNPPGWLIHAAVPGYQRFRKEVEAIANAHRKTLDGLEQISWTVEGARGLASLQRAGDGGPGPAEIEGFLEDVLAMMRERRLAPPSGSAPLHGPLATAIVLGADPRWSPLGPMYSLPVVPGLAGGTLIQGLAYAQLLRSTGGAPALADVAALGLTIPAKGKGLMAEQYQLIDGQAWVLRRIGGVRLKDIEVWSRKLRQQIQASLRETDQAIGFT